MDSTTSWAPQSPDLSASAYDHHADTEAPIHPQHQAYRGSFSSVAPLDSSPTLQAAPLAPPTYMPRGVRPQESMQDAEYAPEPITIKNHFPVARIKRIMQADDDVGKVAQVTPVVVCTCPVCNFFLFMHANVAIAKALELFMISLVTKAAAEAKTRNSKRVGAIHLKQAITKNEQFDFLNDIVSKVADAPEKNEGDSMDVDGKKKKTPGRRKKKVDSDDEF